MAFRSDQLPFIFIHIPRTGGLAINKLLSNIFKKSEKFLMYVESPKGNAKDTVDRFIGLSQFKKNKINYLGGHASFGLHKFYPKHNYFTMLRSPIDRIVSIYSLALESKSHYLHDVILSNQWTLSEFIESEISPELNNGMVRMISGEENIPFGQCSEDMLKKAKENIENYFPAFGITERFNESVALINCKYNLNLKVFENKYNSSKVKLSRNQLTDKEISYVLKKNSLDVELYRFAIRKFEKLLNDEGEEFEKEINKINSKKEFYHQKLTLKGALSFFSKS